MGFDPVTAAIILGTTSMGASVYSGYQQNKAAKAEAAALNDQANLAQAEASRSADIAQQENDRLRRSQKLAFIKSGVSLEGSPLLLLEQTRQFGKEQVQSILSRGQAQAGVLSTQASQAKNQGRAALVGGIGSAAQAGLNTFAQIGALK